MTIAAFDGPQVERILGTEGMIRSRRKIEAIINNAQKYIKVREQFGSFDTYLWRYTEGRTLVYRSHMKGEGCAENQLSQEISRDMRKRGFRYVGPVTIYSHLQACGLINDHIPQCWRFEEVNQLGDVKYVD